MKYLDASPFIAAVVDPGKIGDACRAILRRIHNGEMDGATSTLTWDEIAYVVWRRLGREAGLDAGRRFLGIRRLRLVPVDPQLLRDADGAARDYGLRPRDAIHAACARRAGAMAIVSEDRDFDRLPDIAREWV